MFFAGEMSQFKIMYRPPPLKPGGRKRPEALDINAAVNAIGDGKAHHLLLSYIDELILDSRNPTHAIS